MVSKPGSVSRRGHSGQPPGLLSRGAGVVADGRDQQPEEKCFLVRDQGSEDREPDETMGTKACRTRYSV